jgi:Mlc titration factor MtfA (ptsG expression regulator)
MFLGWLRRRRRQRILARPFPPAWTGILERNLYHYKFLTGDEQARLRGDVAIFVAEKNWEGCGGLELTEEIKVTIAGLACLLLLHLEHDHYAGVLSILVYPRGYLVPRRNELDMQADEPHLGEAWYRGPVILSWSQIRRDCRRPGWGHNLVWHEFAHQLDMLDRETNGTPPLQNRQQRIAWRDVMTEEFQQLRRASKRREETFLDPYGAENEAEFFAVATETFFDQPHELLELHPRLYGVLKDYFRQDPVARLPRPEADHVGEIENA